MKIKSGNKINIGEMVTIKPEDYKAPHPTGEYLGFSVQSHDMPFGIVVDMTKKEKGSGGTKCN